MLLYAYSIFDNIVLYLPQSIKESAWELKKDPNKNYIHLTSFLLPDKEQRTFIDTISNKKDNREIFINKSEVEIFMPAPENIPTWYMAVNILNVILALFALVILITIPILFFKTLKSVNKNNIFTSGNTKRIRLLAFCIIGIGIIETVFNISQRYAFSEFVQLEGYKVSYYDSVDIFGLIFGVTLLVIAEAMKQAIKMKEEQELTI